MFDEPVRTTVYIAEDHPVFRGAVAQAVRARPQFDLVGTASDGETALAAIRELVPAVAILDQTLPGLGGTEILRTIQREELATRVVMLSADSSSALVYETVSLGGAAFLTKAATLVEICDTVSAVARGEIVLAAEVQAGLANELRERRLDGRPLLSERELEVLRLVAEGLTGPQIAGQLFISASTVKTHVKSVLGKLDAADRAAAVAEGLRRGLID